MSFSSGVKDELSRHQTLARHCQIAEIAAIISMCGGVSISEKDHYSLKIQTENVYVARKYFTLLKKAFNIEVEVSIRQGTFSKGSRTYTVAVLNHEDAIRILKAARLFMSFSKAKYSAAVSAILGVAIRSTAGSFARFINITVLSIAPVSLKLFTK